MAEVFLLRVSTEGSRGTSAVTPVGINEGCTEAGINEACRPTPHTHDNLSLRKCSEAATLRFAAKTLDSENGEAEGDEEAVTVKEFSKRNSF